MNINDDFSIRASAHTRDIEWIASPMAGVDRKMLDRIGGEVARATTIVRYAPGSAFSPHIHTGGEEFLVLEGVFQDEHGDFPAGSYVRNPPQSRHTPGSDPGCTIFVKLWQFDLHDRLDVKLRANDLSFKPSTRDPGCSSALLHEDPNERVTLEQWAANSELSRSYAGGAELLVLDGGFVENDEAFAQFSWLRLPAASTVRLQVGPRGARVWSKTKHLHADAIRLPALGT